ncbi:MAG: hypothetical protein R6U50_05955 [Desulfobacterales bacterium]
MRAEKPRFKLRLMYCGGCNPEIDRPGIVDALTKRLKAASIDIHVTSKEGPSDIILLVNGCPHACREEELLRMPAHPPFLSVQGARLQHQPLPEKDIPDALFNEIKSILGI